MFDTSKLNITPFEEVLAKRILAARANDFYGFTDGQDGFEDIKPEEIVGPHYQQAILREVETMRARLGCAIPEGILDSQPQTEQR